jgi:hypothetical protein
MKKITDERLVLQNLKHIRWAFISENLVLLGFIVAQGLRGNWSAALSWGNPLFVVFMTGCYVMVVLTVGIRAQQDDKPQARWAKLALIDGAIWLGVAAFFYVTILSGPRLLLAVMCGGIVTAVVLATQLIYRHYSRRG